MCFFERERSDKSWFCLASRIGVSIFSRFSGGRRPHEARVERETRALKEAAAKKKKL